MGSKSLTDRSQIKKQDIAAAVILAAGIVFLYLISPYTCGYDDESYYLTTANRLIQGDTLFSDEWGTQLLSSVYQYLPLKLFLSIHGSYDGVILFFRHCFIAVNVTYSLLVYLLLRKQSRYAPMIEAMCLLFVPWHIMSISYNTCFVWSAMLSSILFYRAALIFKESELKKKQLNKAKVFFVLGGICYANCVVCIPPCALVYFIFIAAGLIALKKKNSAEYHTLLCSSLIFISTGVVIMAAVYCVFLFCHTDLTAIFGNIDTLFMDPEHSGIISKSMLIEKYQTSMPAFFAFIALIAANIALALIIRAKRRSIHNRVLLITAAAVCGFYTLLSLVLKIHTGSIYMTYFNIAFSLLGLQCLLITEKKDKRLVQCFFIYGPLLALFAGLSSKMSLDSVNNAAIVTACGSFFAVEEVMPVKQPAGKKAAEKRRNRRHTDNKRRSRSLAAALLCAAIIIQPCAYLCADTAGLDFFLSDDQNAAGEIAKNGPKKGTCTANLLGQSVEKAYGQMTKDAEYINDNFTGNVLVAGFYPWLYLALDLKMGTFDAGTFVNKFTTVNDKRVDLYYQRNPDKYPDVIYLPKVCKDGYEGSFTSEEDALAGVLSYFKGRVVHESSAGYVIIPGKAIDKEFSYE